MIHKIKAMYDGGRGSSMRKIARTLQVSRNTVRKYLALDEASIDAARRDHSRHKVLDVHRAYIVHLLETFPKLSAVKVQCKLKEKVGPACSARSIPASCATCSSGVWRVRSISWCSSCRSRA